jgi:hypothetical protein
LLVDLFRSGEGFSVEVISQAENAIDALAEVVVRKVKLNKPTLFTWLLFFAIEGRHKELLYFVDDLRGKVKSGGSENDLQTFLIDIYQDKSATSVNDAIPVQLRILGKLCISDRHAA